MESMGQCSGRFSGKRLWHPQEGVFPPTLPNPLAQRGEESFNSHIWPFVLIGALQFKWPFGNWF